MRLIAERIFSGARPYPAARVPSPAEAARAPPEETAAVTLPAPLAGVRGKFERLGSFWRRGKDECRCPLFLFVFLLYGLTYLGLFGMMG